MIILTGAAGFIGSNVLQLLNKYGESVLAVDSLDSSGKWSNLAPHHIVDYIDKDELFNLLDPADVELVIHLGARTDTMDQDVKMIMEDNFQYTKRLWEWCTKHRVRFVYASSASVYGNGLQGFSEAASLDHVLPLNPYAYSKLLFDRWVLQQKVSPPAWFGLRFFNVYGPNESHKGRMASVVLHAYNQIIENGSVALFKSYRSDFAHGAQTRDFVFVGDVARIVCHFGLTKQTADSGFYNVGTGKARSFNDLARTVFDCLNIPVNIRYIDMPEGLEKQYQYHTEANLARLRKHGHYVDEFSSLEAGVRSYLDELSTKSRVNGLRLKQ